MSQEHPFGYWLRRSRKALDLTQAELANQVGCSPETIRKIEAEERRPSAQIVERLAEIFNIPSNERKMFLSFARGDWTSAPHEAVTEVPWQTSTLSPRSNLPATVTSLIGREKEIVDVREYLLDPSIRLVSLIGPPGIGKTRLSIEAARAELSDFQDGVFFIALAPLEDPILVAPTIAQTLGLVEMHNRFPLEQLKDGIGNKQMLIVLDNVEHLIEGTATLVAGLLSVCPRLKILTTSREALRVPGEWLYPVPTLRIPTQTQLQSIEMQEISQFAALSLFSERARAVQLDFTLNAENIWPIASICTQLDGLPLAIELIAARIRLMSPQALLSNLSDQFTLHADGMRAMPTRQKTLHNAIGWSYRLLSTGEQNLLARLSVFAGGWSLEAAESVCSGDGLESNQIIDLLRHLVDKSLVVVETQGAETRYHMLETIRQYARERLDEFGEKERVRQCHHDFFITLAEQAESKLKGPQQLEWLDRLEAEHDNLRAVLQWTHEVGDVKTTFRLTEVLIWFWKRRGYLGEGRVWLERALAAEPALTTSARATLLYQLATVARAQGDFAGARKFVEQSIVLWRTLDSEDKQGLSLALTVLAHVLRDAGDPGTARSLAEESVKLSREQGNAWSLAASLISLGMALRDQADYDLAQSTIEESIRIWQELDDLWGLAQALHYLGLVAYRRGDYQVAYSLIEEVLSIQRQLGDKQQIAYCIHNLGIFTLAQGNIDRARPFFEQDLVLFREIGDRSGVVLSLQYQGLFARLQGDDLQAQSFLKEGLTLARETGPLWISSSYLLWLAALAADRGQLQRAVRLCSAADTHLNAVASFWDAFEYAHYEGIIDLARVSLGENAFALAQAEGQAMTLEQAVAYALEDMDV